MSGSFQARSPADAGFTAINRRAALKAALAPLALAAAGLAAACAAPTPTPAPPQPAAPAPKPAAAPTAAAAPKATAPAPTAAPPKVTQIMPWRAGLPSPNLDINAYHTFPIRKGWYREFGLDVELKRLPDPTALKALVAGELESVDTGLGPALEAMQQGAELKAVASGHTKVPFVFFARKGINSLQDLYGKTVGISEKGSITESFVLALLFKRGLDPDKITWASLGSGTVALFNALVAGKIDAATGTVSQIPQAERQPDLQVLASIAEELPLLTRLTLIVPDKLLRDKPDQVVSFLAAYAKGMRYGLDHRDETIALAAEITGGKPEDMAFSFDWSVKNKALDPNFGLSAEQVNYYQDLYVKLGLLRQMMPLERVADLTIHQKVLAKVGPYQPGKTA